MQLKREVKMRPSEANRWLVCDGSSLMAACCEVRPVDNWHAAQGTTAHWLLEQCLKNNEDPRTYLGKAYTVEPEHDGQFPITFNIDEDMIAAVEMFLSIVAEESADINHSEQTIAHPEMTYFGGTADYISYHRESRTLTVRDLKYGQSVVTARKRDGSMNPQLMCYLLLAWTMYPLAKTFKVQVVQPRLKTKSKTREATVTMSEMIAFEKRVRAKHQLLVNAIETGIMPQVKDGGHCWYCPAKSTCPAARLAWCAKDFS